nr:hypothetical protein [Tanacetum cinerariifolium]
MGTLSLVSEYLKDLEECIDDGDSRVAKEEKLFDALEHKSVVTEVDNQKITIFTKAPLRAFDSTNYVTKKVLKNMGFVHVSLSNYGIKMVNDVIVEIHRVKFKDDFVVLDYVNEEEPSILFGRDFLATTKTQVDFGLGEIRMNLTKLEEIPPISTIPPQPIYHPLTAKQKEKMKEVKINSVVEMVALVDTGASSHVEAFEMEGEDDWLRSFEVGRDEDGNVKYGSVATSFIDIEDDMERALAIEAYFNPFKNKVNGDEDWHARFEIVTPSGRKFNQAFKTKTTTMKLSGKFKTEDDLRTLLLLVWFYFGLVIIGLDDLKSRKDTLLNPLITEYERRNKRNTITYSLKPVSNANLKWKDLPSVKRHAYCEKLSKLQEMSFGVPRVANWRFCEGYGFEDTLREMMKLEYIYKGDGDVFVDYSWERALSTDNEIYPEWVLEFFSTLYFHKDVDRNNLMKEKCIWFRLCGHKHILILPDFTVVLGLFTYDEVKHRLFKVYFGRVEVDDKQFGYKDYWTRVGKPTLTNHKEVLVKEPLMQIVHKVIVGSLVHRVTSRERCQKRDLWLMSALKESHGVNLAWIIADHLYKHVLGTKENNVICAGHYVTKIACFLRYCVDDEIKKCSEPIDCEYWISKMLADELDVENTCLKKETEMPTQAEEGSRESWQDHGGLNSSWGDWNANLSMIERGNVWRDSMLMRNYHMLEHSMPILYHFADQATKEEAMDWVVMITSAMPDSEGRSSGYAVGGLSREAGFNDDGASFPDMGYALLEMQST